MPTSPDTVTEVLTQLEAEGYSVHYELTGGLLRADGCEACSVDDVVVERVYRFEGNSDPGDEMIVFALRDPLTGARGTLASAFGSGADPALSEHLTGMARRFG